MRPLILPSVGTSRMPGSTLSLMLRIETDPMSDQQQQLENQGRNYSESVALAGIVRLWGGGVPDLRRSVLSSIFVGNVGRELYTDTRSVFP